MPVRMPARLTWPTKVPLSSTTKMSPKVLSRALSIPVHKLSSHRHINDGSKRSSSPPRELRSVVRFCISKHPSHRRQVVRSQLRIEKDNRCPVALHREWNIRELAKRFAHGQLP